MAVSYRYATQVDGPPLLEITTTDDVTGQLLSVSDSLAPSDSFTVSQPTQVLSGFDPILKEPTFSITDVGGELLSGSLDPADSPIRDGLTLVSQDQWISASVAWEIKVGADIIIDDDKFDPDHRHGENIPEDHNHDNGDPDSHRHNPNGVPIPNNNNSKKVAKKTAKK